MRSTLARHADGIHDLLLRLGDLSAEELRLRCQSAEVFAQVETLLQSRRVLLLMIAGEPRYVAVEYASQYRDALGAVLPEDLADTWLQPTARTAAGIAEPLFAHPRSIYAG